jgi:hypothetical protein
MNRGRSRPLRSMSHGPRRLIRAPAVPPVMGGSVRCRLNGKDFEPDLDIQQVVCRLYCLHGPRPPAALVTKTAHDGSPTCHLGPRR